MRLNEADPAWLRGLPDLIVQLERRWSLTVEPHFPGLNYNYVAPALRAGPGVRPTPCVLKLSRRVDEAANEIAALRHWHGRGAARLLEADPKLGALLIDRVQPGTMLMEVAETNDDAATLITADLLRQLWTSARPDDLRGLRPLGSWCAAFDRNREALSRGADGFPAALFRRADALRAELLASAPRPTALHGDMHQFNVLQGHGGRWVAIDPKGLAGDRCFDVCQFMRHPRDRPHPELNRRRLDIFCAELGLDRQRTDAWRFVHAMLDACWDFEGPAVREGAGALSHDPNRPERIARGADRWRPAVAHAEATLSF